MRGFFFFFLFLYRVVLKKIHSESFMHLLYNKNKNPTHVRTTDVVPDLRTWADFNVNYYGKSISGNRLQYKYNIFVTNTQIQSVSIYKTSVFKSRDSWYPASALSGLF